MAIIIIDSFIYLVADSEPGLPEHRRSSQMTADHYR